MLDRFGKVPGVALVVVRRYGLDNRPWDAWYNQLLSQGAVALTGQTDDRSRK